MRQNSMSAGTSARAGETSGRAGTLNATVWPPSAMRPSQTATVIEVDDWKKRYADRFFTTPDQTIHDQMQDIKRDGTVQSFDQLWERREG